MRIRRGGLVHRLLVRLARRAELTGRRVVHRIITDRAVLDVTPEGLTLVELAPDYTIGDVRACTEPHLLLAPQFRS